MEDSESAENGKDVSNSSPSTSNDDNQAASSKDRHDELRGAWGGRFEFLLAIIGYTVATGSIWRFPIIAAKNGGGAFLIPFVLLTVLSGGPLYYLEVCLGQFSGQSAINAFSMCPLFKGLGLLMVIISLLVLWYIMIIMAWIIYYFYCSFFPNLEWATCGNWWNTPDCKEYFESSSKLMMSSNGTNVTSSYNVTDVNVLYQAANVTPTISADTITRATMNSPTYQFWINAVLRRSDGLENFGEPQVHLVICLFISYTILVLAVIKGTKTLGKIVYVTATLPFLLLTVILIRGLTLDGAMDGIRFFVTPDFSKLADLGVWLEAAVQVFFSLGPTWGGVITMSSFNHFHKRNVWDTTLCVCSDLFTACYSGLVVFSVLGFMAHESGVSVAQLAKDTGPGLAFVAYPTALTRMPYPNLWAILFFGMLITVAFDTDFGMMETIVSAVIDVFPSLVTKRPLVNVCTGLVLFILSLPFCCNGGFYLFKLADWYSSAFALLLGAALEGIIVCWIYGTDRFANDVYIMTGRDTSVLLRFLWTIVTPIAMTVVFFLLLVGYSHPNYGDDYEYKPYAIGIGFILGLLPIVMMLVYGIYMVVVTPGTPKKISNDVCSTDVDPHYEAMDWTHPYRTENHGFSKRN